MNGFPRWALVCLALVAFTFFVAATPAPDESRDEGVWQTVGPVPSTVGFTAVASDPANPQVVWIGGGASVWVSDSGGEHFALLLQLSRLSGSVRETGKGEQVDSSDTPDEEDGVTEGEETDEDGVTDDDTLPDEPETAPTTGGEAATTTEGVGDPTIDDSGDSDTRFGVTRIRVYGDSVYVCTGRGLWVVERSARHAGAGHEVRFGRRIAVNDVAVDAAGRLFVATEAGLLVVGSDGIGRSVTGFTDEVDILAMDMLGDRLVVAASDGLRIQSDVGFQRFGTLGARESISDLVALDATRLAIAGSGQVFIMVLEGGQPALLEDVQSVPGASRLAAGRDGDLWAVGQKGAWHYRAETGWVPQNAGLLDRRLADVASSAAGPAHLYAVGRAGAVRLVPDVGRIWSARARALATQALEGLPSAAETLAWAEAAQPVQIGDGEALVVQQGLSWLLPTVTLTFRATQNRYENRMLVPALNERLLSSVRVIPRNEVFRVELRWDLMPALIAAFSATDRQVFDLENRARRAQAKVRQTVGPLYESWVTKRVELAATEHGDALAVAKDLLLIEQMEADLHVYTDGHFPVGTEKDPSTSTH